MLDLNDASLFVQVVDCGGFASASRMLGLAKSGISQRISRLEKQVGARLIHRTSRQFHLTEAGAEFYRHARAMVIEAEAAELAVAKLRTEPIGTVAVTSASATLLSGLDDVLFEIGRRYPGVQITLHAGNDFFDLIERGIDIAVRSHRAELPSSSLVQRRLGFSERWIVAAPAYLRQHEPIRGPQDLEGHDAVVLQRDRPHDCWTIMQEGRSISVSVRPKLSTNDFALTKSALLAGLGLAMLPAGMCASQVEDGSLERVLPGCSAGDSSISLLVPDRRGLLPSVRAVLDALASELPARMRLRSGPTG